MEKAKLLNNKGSSLMTRASLVLILVALCIVIGIAKPVFFTYTNIFNLLRTTSIKGLVAIGMTYVIITGGIDLSVGSVIGFTSVLIALLIEQFQMPAVFAVLIAMVCGTLIGVINGIVIHKGKVPPFIATLGTMQVFSGMAMLFADGRTIPGMPKELTGFAQLKILGLPSLFIVWLVVTILAIFVLKWTCFGRNIYSTGSNMEASRLSGINIGKTTIGVYAVSAFCSALAGWLITARITSGQPAAGTGYEMEAIAAAVIGGASLSGAEGSIGGTILGALIMQVLVNGGNLLGINSFVMDIIVGALVVVAVLIDKNKKKVRV